MQISFNFQRSLEVVKMSPKCKTAEKSILRMDDYFSPTETERTRPKPDGEKVKLNIRKKSLKKEKKLQLKPPKPSPYRSSSNKNTHLMNLEIRRRNESCF